MPLTWLTRICHLENVIAVHQRIPSLKPCISKKTKLNFKIFILYGIMQLNLK